MPHFSRSLERLGQDEILATVIDQLSSLPEPQINPVLFDALLESVISQQLSIKAAATIHARFIELVGDIEPLRLLEIDDAALRKAGLSQRKCEYVKSIAHFFIEHDNLDWSSMSDSAIRQELITIRGVGMWTIDMILMFCLDRPDVFPIGDLIIKQSISILYGMDIDDKSFLAKADKISQGWRPYRSDACLLLWAWNRELRHRS